jgi:hypothetical protein
MSLSDENGPQIPVGFGIPQRWNQFLESHSLFFQRSLNLSLFVGA